MPRIIVLPLDGSNISARAIPFAEGIARAAGSRLALVRSTRAGRLGDLGADPFGETTAAEAEADLNAVADHLKAGGVRVETSVSDMDPAAAIVRAADERQADIIVMSTHGRSGLRRAVFGSVADQVLRTTITPVLLVPPDAHYRINPPCTIVVALDGSKQAEAAIPPALDLAEALRGQVRLIRATDPPTYWLTDGQAADREPDAGSGADLARQYLETVAERWTSKNVDISGYVTDGAADEVIVEAARDSRAGAVAMATHGRTGLARLVIGSVTERVLHEASVPLLLVHPGRDRQSGDRGPSAGSGPDRVA